MEVISKKRKKGRGSTLDKKDETIKRAKKEVDGEIDYLPDLPEPVLHHILSLLHPKDAARMCILSKTWRRAWNSRQVLDFDLSRFHWMNIDLKRTYKNLIDQSLVNCKQQSLNIHKFRLRFGKWCWREPMLDINSWIEDVVERNVKELEIHSKYFTPPLALPTCVMRGSSITELNLGGCELPNIDISLPHLRKLSLSYIILPPLMFPNLISGCPLIEDLRLIKCIGFKNWTICTLDKLKRLDIYKCDSYNCDPIQSIVIGVHRLETFWYYHRRIRPCNINLPACRSLKNLMLEYPVMTDAMFQVLLLELAALEKLVLSKCNGLQRIRVFGDNLRDLQIRRCKKLALVHIEAPHLRSLEYHGLGMPFSFLSPLLSLKEAQLSFKPSSKFDGHDVCNLNSFYGYLNPHNGLKLMTQNRSDVLIYEDMRARILPLHLQHISKPHTIKISASFGRLLDGALRTSSYPSIISILSQRSSDFPETIYEELNKGRAEPMCCAYFNNKCWRHYLDNISVESWNFESSDSSGASTSLQWKKTTLTLNWNIVKTRRKTCTKKKKRRKTKKTKPS